MDDLQLGAGRAEEGSAVLSPAFCDMVKHVVEAGALQMRGLGATPAHARHRRTRAYVHGGVLFVLVSLVINRI